MATAFKVNEMERVHKIWVHPLYQEQYIHLQEAERDRIFCNHTLSHFLDVARLMYLYALTEQVGLERHLIYAAAMLHDIGRYAQLTEGIPHEQASANLAQIILPECGYTKSETNAVCAAILGHRSKQEKKAFSEEGKTMPNAEIISSVQKANVPGEELAALGESLLSSYLRRADKQSRCCFACPAAAECHWPEEKKNSQILL